MASTAAVIATQPLWAFDLLGWAMPRILWRVETREPLVALSFDDGPAPDHTPQVLEILSRHSAHATFFLIGDRAVAHPDLVGRRGGKGTRWATTDFTIRSTVRAGDEEFLANLLANGRGSRSAGANQVVPAARRADPPGPPPVG